MTEPVVLSGAMLGLVALYLMGRYLAVRRRSRERAYELAAPELPPPADDEDEGALTRWLGAAGYRAPGAAANFVGLTLLGLLGGVLGAVVLVALGVSRRAAESLGNLPPAVGGLLLPLVHIAPWTLVLLLGGLPYVRVRAARRRREAAVEQDLPLLLELLATLGEAGLGFDAALDRVLDALPPERPVSAELRAYQREVLAGRPRVRSLRRLARRLDVTAFTVFVSALVQAEQTGMGLADVLRRQADDLRDRRRERAVALAMALPVKLLFPLVLCFLPGIFVVTLGPAFYQVFQIADNLFRGRGP